MNNFWLKTQNALLLGLLLLGLPACVPHLPGAAMDSALFPAEDFTGGLEPGSGIPYTRAQEDGLLQGLKQEILQVTPSPDEKIISSLTDFSLSYILPGNGSLVATIALDLVFSTTDTLSLTMLETSEKEELRTFEATSLPSHRILSASAFCTDSTCSSQVVELVLVGEDETEQPLALIQRQDDIFFHWRTNGDISPYVPSEVLNIYQGRITTKEVPFSFSRLNIELQPDLCFEGDLLATNTSASQMNWSCANAPIHYELKLIGNTQAGAWLFAITSGEQTLGHLEASTEIKKLPSSPQEESADSEPLATVSLGDLRLVPTHGITSAWELDEKVYDYQGKIQKQAEEWLSGPYRERIQDYVLNMLPRAQEIIPHFDARNIPHEFIFVTLWESEYFTSPGYPVQVGGSGEVGPWQFIKATARSPQVGLKAFDWTTSNGGRIAHPCDERGNLSKSSAGAAKYWEWLLQRFSQDPHLSVLAYNWGIGHVNTTLQRCQTSGGDGSSCRDHSTQRVQDAYRDGYNFWVIEGFNMAPRVRLDYVLKFLAAYSIFKNHRIHELVLPDPSLAKPSETWGAGCN